MSTNDSTSFMDLHKSAHNLAQLALESRVLRALEDGAQRYPIYRTLRFAARIELEALLDAIALDPAWRAERLHAEAMVLDAKGLFVAAYGGRKADYCSCSFFIWAADLARAQAAKELILAKVGATRITKPMFTCARSPAPKRRR